MAMPRASSIDRPTENLIVLSSPESQTEIREPMFGQFFTLYLSHAGPDGFGGVCFFSFPPNHAKRKPTVSMLFNGKPINK